MPKQQILPTWTSFNNANFANQSGMSDPVSGEPYNSGGLNLGDYFDVTNDEAASMSYKQNGLCFAGRYRLVQVDSGATAANVKTGTVGYVRSGSTVKSVVITDAGSGGTNGTYTINANTGSGGGTGAQISVTVSGGAVTSVSVVNGGYGYVSAPTFNVATPTGATAATVSAQLGISVNVVTSADIALGGNPNDAGVGAVRPVIFLNSITPGNYGFIQELGVATVLCNNAVEAANQFAIVDDTAKNGTLAASSATFGPFAVGYVIDTFASAPPAGTPFKILLDGPVVQD